MNDLVMTAEELKKTWKDEEDCAFIKGWDFSHIHGRYEEEDSLPWDNSNIQRIFWFAVKIAYMCFRADSRVLHHP